MADVLVVSHYQAECQEAGCEWAHVIRSDYADAQGDAASHAAVHQLRDQRAAQAHAGRRLHRD